MRRAARLIAGPCLLSQRHMRRLAAPAPLSSFPSSSPSPSLPSSLSPEQPFPLVRPRSNSRLHIHTSAPSPLFSAAPSFPWSLSAYSASFSNVAQEDDDKAGAHSPDSPNPQSESPSADGQSRSPAPAPAPPPTFAPLGPVGGPPDPPAAGLPEVQRQGGGYYPREPEAAAWGPPSLGSELQKVPWNASLQNTVSLVGVLRHMGDWHISPSGRPMVRCRLGVLRPRWLKERHPSQSPHYDQTPGASPPSDEEWYTVYLFGELADAVTRGLIYRGQRVVVQGTLHQDSFLSREGEPKHEVVVTAKSIAEVLSQEYSGYDPHQGMPRTTQGGSWEPSLPIHTPGTQANFTGGFGVGGARVKRRKEEVWREFVESPSNFIDCRLNKTNPRGPDFVHARTGDALWVNSMPSWVPEHLLVPPPSPPLGS